MKQILLLVFSLMGVHSYAQFDFSSTILRFQIGVRDVDFADLNNDGLIDLVAAGDGTVFSYLNNSNGYDARLIYETDETFFLEIEDLDQDGNPDVILLTSETNSLKILENNGGSDPVFTFREYPFGDFPSALTVADINQDGLPDILMGFGGGDRFVHLVNDNDFNFSVNNELDLGFMSPTEFVVLDWNQDGMNDLLILPIFSFSDSTYVYLNDGSSLAFEKQFLDEIEAPGAAAVGDLTGNGSDDIVVSTLFDGLLLYSNTDQGVVKETIDSDLIISRAATVVDLDNDDDLEIVLLENAETLVGYENDGDDFRKSILSNNRLGGESIRTLDFDGDNDMDLLTVSFFTDQILLFENNLSLTSTTDLPVNSISVFPNPASTHLQVESDVIISSLKLFDITGRLVNSSENTSLDLTDLVSGVYLLEVETASGSITQKVVKE